MYVLALDDDTHDVLHTANKIKMIKNGNQHITNVPTTMANVLETLSSLCINVRRSFSAP
jgi:hypothetical protein